MSGKPEDTGQISVAELLARNGQQVESRGGRRRRGAAGGISVAELTGELPVVSDADVRPRNRRAAPDPDDDIAGASGAGAVPAAPAPRPEAPDPIPSVSTTPEVTPPSLPVAPGVPAEVDHTQAIPALRRAVLAKADADRKAAADRSAQDSALSTAAPAGTVPPTVSGPIPSPAPAAASTATPAPASAVEKTTVVDAVTPAAGGSVASGSVPSAGLGSESPAEKTTVVPAASTGRRFRPEPEPEAPDASAGSKAKPYTGTPTVREPALLSGSSLEADLLRQARSARTESLDEARALVHTTGEFPRVTDTPGAAEATDVTVAPAAKPAGRDDTGPAPAVDDEDDGPAEQASTSRGGALRQWAVLVGQAVVAIVAGALLFKGFEKLWESLPWVALVLAVLVIAGLVAVVRILRQTEDLLSLLIAVIVGVFVTIGPLVFVLSSS
ncbi:hypothetical protein ACWF62_10485 [Rhodococcus sp. NPDC054953]